MSRQGKINNSTRLLLEKLEELFCKYPGGFEKHGSPRKDQKNLDGLSWEEELSISKKTFKAAFKTIGVIYKSVAEYEQAGADKFEGKFYCAVVNLSNHGRTFYSRNDELIEALSKNLSTVKNLENELALSE